MTLFAALHRLCRCAALCAALAACARAEPSTEAPAAPPAAGPGDLADTTFMPHPERVVLPADRIYYTLTEHEWYARGEPLLHEGRAFSPSGMPLAASLPDMERAGEYRGVEFYRRAGMDDALFVPVYRGYWQVFRGAAAAR
ncbi:MAG TPA: hypothetical protein VMN60_07180 [Longimicrobiales bacterium]|nr:hypothetical protein [Longimicrobiales bacterium]